jgi:hypothetical protein
MRGKFRRSGGGAQVQTGQGEIRRGRLFSGPGTASWFGSEGVGVRVGQSLISNQSFDSVTQPSTAGLWILA